MKHTVCIKTGDHLVKVDQGANLMEALVSSGIMLRSDCGGRGRCGKCLVNVDKTEIAAINPPGEGELEALRSHNAGESGRLACCVYVFDNISLRIPDESLLSPEVVQKGPPVLMWRVKERTPLDKRETSDGYGVAVDLGTTTIAIYLCDLATYSIAGSTSVRNPQAIFGDDVISRIAAARTMENGSIRFQAMAASTIDWGIRAMCGGMGIEPLRIRRLTVAGNTTMIHMLLGEDTSSIGVYPYAPRFLEARTRSAGSLGFTFNPGAIVRTLPMLSGFLGADIIGAAMAADIYSLEPGTVLVDVGTNGEIMLVTEEGLAAASCATGPALEGAAIKNGMQATSGAIDSVLFNPRTKGLDYSLIQRNFSKPQPPVGICGSGVISSVAELLRAGIIMRDGSFDPDNDCPFLKKNENGGLEFEIIPGSPSGNRRPIILDQTDVRAVQLAKGALRTGIQLLCEANNLERPSRILLAGAFGSYINKSDALRIGMFPDMPEEHVEVVGNAAGAGAILALFNEACLRECGDIAAGTKVLDLAAHPDFQNTFINFLSF